MARKPTKTTESVPEPAAVEDAEVIKEVPPKKATRSSKPATKSAAKSSPKPSPRSQARKPAPKTKVAREKASAVTEPQTPAPDSSPEPAPVQVTPGDTNQQDRSQPSTMPVIIAAGLALIIGAGAVYLLQPSTRDTQAEIDQLSAQIEALSTAVSTPAPDTGTAEAVSRLEGALSDELGGISGTIGALNERLADVDARMAALETQPDSAPDEVTGVIESLRGDLLSWQQEAERLRSENRDLTNRVAVLESELAQTSAALEKARDVRAQTGAERTSGLIAQIEVAMAEGRPFADIAAELGAHLDTELPPAIQQAASSGVATQDDLRAAFPQAARAALLDSLKAQADANPVARTTSFLRAQLGVRSVVPRDGDDADAILSRAQAAVDAGDLQAAIAEISNLPDPGQAQMAAWVDAARLRAQALSELGTLAGEAK